jgi:hypothetical protein
MHFMKKHKGERVETVPHHCACCPATLSPVVLIHPIDVMREGWYLDHTAVIELVRCFVNVDGSYHLLASAE